MKYIDSEKLMAEIKRLDEKYRTVRVSGKLQEAREADLVIRVLHNISITITSLQREQSDMIQWTGNNLKEVIDFTGKSPRFEEWFKSWEEFETYVHQHNDILKLFCEDGSHYEVPVGAWIIKTPDGYNVPSVSRFIHVKHEQPEVTFVNIDNRIQYASIEDGIKAHAEIYSFNIESQLFPQLTKEQQALWRKEIEQACISGGEVGVELAKDVRYKENQQPDVELEREICDYFSKWDYDYYNSVITMDNDIAATLSSIQNVARHFYKLGRARKEE